MQLVPCAQCRRHVDTREAACPFCGASVIGGRASARTTLGRLSRAAVFAGAAACYTGSTTTTTTTTPPPPDPAGMGGGDGGGSFAKPPPPHAGHALVRGIVSVDGRPAANVTVYLRSDKRTMSITSNAHGEYVFEDLEAGEYTLYSDAVGRFGPPQQHLVLGADQKLTANLSGATPPVDRGPCCKPYGAPPARRRVV